MRLVVVTFPDSKKQIKHVKAQSNLSGPLLENSDNDTALKLIAINKLSLSDVWGPS